MSTRFVLLFPILLTLAACGQPTGVGVSTETGVGEGTESASLIDRVKSLFVGWGAKASVQYPAAGLIVEALKGDEEMMIGSIPRMLQVNAAQQGQVMREFLDEETIRKTVDTFMADKSRWNTIGIKEIRTALASGDRKEVERTMRVSSYRFPIMWSTTPCVGWEISAQLRFDEPSPEEVAAEAAYVHSFEAAVSFSNAVMTDIAAKLAPNVLRDPDQAKAAARKLWFAQDPEVLQALWEQAIDSTGRGYTPDLTGIKGVGWMASGSRYDCAGSGVVQQKNGQVWFGENKLTGREYMVGLESAIGGEFRRSIGESDSGSAGTNSGSTGQAGVQ